MERVRVGLGDHSIHKKNNAVTSARSEQASRQLSSLLVRVDPRVDPSQQHPQIRRSPGVWSFFLPHKCLPYRYAQPSYPKAKAPGRPQNRVWP